VRIVEGVKLGSGVRCAGIRPQGSIEQLDGGEVGVTADVTHHPPPLSGAPNDALAESSSRNSHTAAATELFPTW
jgi:hypothetical protein